MLRLHVAAFAGIRVVQAYANLEDLISMTEDLLHGLVLDLHGTPKVEINGKVVDFTPPFRRVEFMEELNKASGLEVQDLALDDDELNSKLQEASTKLDLECPDPKTTGASVGIVT